MKFLAFLLVIACIFLLPPLIQLILYGSVTFSQKILELIKDSLDKGYGCVVMLVIALIVGFVLMLLGI